MMQYFNDLRPLEPKRLKALRIHWAKVEFEDNKVIHYAKQRRRFEQNGNSEDKFSDALLFPLINFTFSL